MTSCRRCGQNSQLIKAHAIPEAFFRDVRGATPDLLLVSDGKQLPKMSRIGVYDSTILCANCEALFGAVDSYGAQALTAAAVERRFTPARIEGRIIGHECAELDPRRVLQFLVAVLWRASISSHPFYRAVNLGPLEPIALNFALTGVQEQPVFDAVLSRWEPAASSPKPLMVILDPHSERWEGGVRGYRLYLGDVVAYVKADARPFVEQSLRNLGLAQNPGVVVVARNQATSKDLAVVKRTVIRSHLHEQAFHKARGRPSRP